jgi:hypothetical protein
MALHPVIWRVRRRVQTNPKRLPLVEIQDLDFGFGTEIAQDRKKPINTAANPARSRRLQIKLLNLNLSWPRPEAAIHNKMEKSGPRRARRVRRLSTAARLEWG